METNPYITFNHIATTPAMGCDIALCLATPPSEHPDCSLAASRIPKSSLLLYWGSKNDVGHNWSEIKCARTPSHLPEGSLGILAQDWPIVTHPVTRETKIEILWGKVRMVLLSYGGRSCYRVFWPHDWEGFSADSLLLNTQFLIKQVR